MKKISSLLFIPALCVMLISCGGGGGGNNPQNSTSKELTAFSFSSPSSTGVIDQAAKTVSLTVPFGTDLSALKAVFTTTGVKTTVNDVEQESGVTGNDFSGNVTYRVTAVDGSYSDYTVTVNVAASSSREITAFSIVGQNSSSITGTAITVVMPYNTDKTSLVPTITHTGASISPESGIAQNFTNPVKYIVTAADGNKEEYTVTINLALQSWAKNFGGASSDYGRSVCLDSQGNVYVTGSFAGDMSQDDFSLVSGGGSTDAFLVKYSSDGICQWAKPIGGYNIEHGQSICIDSEDNVYFTGSFQGYVDFDSFNLSSSAGSQDAFIAKYTKDGVCLWAEKVGNDGEEVGNAVCVDSSNNVYVTGSFTNKVNFGSGDIVCNGKGDIFIVKYSSDGTYIWSKAIGGSNATYKDDGLSICTGPLGALYVAGSFCAGADFGGGSIADAGSTYGFFIVKYLSDGTYQWVKTSGKTSVAMAASVCTDATGAVYATGNFIGKIDFGNGVVVQNIDGFHAFIVKYSPDGIYQWANTFNGTDGDSYGSDLCIDQSGNLNVTGSFMGPVNFGGESVTSKGGYDIFILKYSIGGAYQQLRTIGVAASSEDCCSICTDLSGSVYVTGMFTETTDFGFGSVTSNGAHDFFLIKN